MPYLDTCPLRARRRAALCRQESDGKQPPVPGERRMPYLDAGKGTGTAGKQKDVA